MSTRIDVLQVGRALAALAVVACHAAMAAEGFGGSTLQIFQYGWLGVDFFFVLSGFIIAYTMKGKSAGTYFWHRFRRIYLPYLPIGVGIALLYTLWPGARGSSNWQWLPTVTLAPVQHTALNVAWTLQHEVLFYAIFGAAWYSRAIWILWVWGAMCFANVFLEIESIMIAPINLEFLFGIVAFMAVSRGIPHRRFWVMSVLPVVIWLSLGADREFSFLVGLSIAFLLPTAVAWEAGGIKIWRPWLILGAASYSIYLVHNPVISVFARLVPSMSILFIVGTLAGIVYLVLIDRPLIALTSRGLPASVNDRSRPTKLRKVGTRSGADLL